MCEAFSVWTQADHVSHGPLALAVPLYVQQAKAMANVRMQLQLPTKDTLENQGAFEGTCRWKEKMRGVPVVYSFRCGLRDEPPCVCLVSWHALTSLRGGGHVVRRSDRPADRRSGARSHAGAAA